MVKFHISKDAISIYKDNVLLVSIDINTGELLEGFDVDNLTEASKIFWETLQTFSCNKKVSSIDRVKEFHDTFGVPTLSAPGIPSQDRIRLRLRLLMEELQELEEAFLASDLLEVYDALEDLQVVLDGTFLECGLHNIKDEGNAEVHASNMSKLGEDGKPIYREDQKILKGPNYFKPNLYKILQSAIDEERKQYYES